MAGFKFVGSQDRIEIPEGSQVVEISSLIPFTRIDIDPFDLLSQSELIGSWLYPVKSAKLNQGGKIIFLTDNGEEIAAVCTSFILGRELSLVADQFGTMTCVVARESAEVVMKVNFKILTLLPAEKRALFNDCIARLSGVCA